MCRNCVQQQRWLLLSVFVRLNGNNSTECYVKRHNELKSYRTKIAVNLQMADQDDPLCCQDGRRCAGI
jgi:hypothetical protein